MALLAGLVPMAAAAQPYRPTDDSQVLLDALRGAPSAPAPQELTPAVAARLAQAHVQRARGSGDARELGYARGVLMPWWNQAEAPEPVLLMRATLRQAAHDFDGALVDLQRLLARNPKVAQGWLTRATVLRVQGRYPEALAACKPLAELSTTFIATLCTQAVRGLQGDARDAAHELFLLAVGLPDQAPAIAAWYYAERADLAVRMGQFEQAGLLYRSALQAHPQDLDLRAAFADLLLERQQPAAVLDLIDDPAAPDPLALRRVLALHVTGDTRFSGEDRTLRQGFAAARRRGDSLHLREEARYLLAVHDDATSALEIAKANWNIQREPWDARLLLHAADAAGQPQAADPVRRWLIESGLQDVRLKPWE